jgi:hypothetical protein
MGERQRFQPIDTLLYAYLVVVAVIAFSRLSTRPYASSVLLVAGLIALLPVLLRRDDLGRFGRGLQEVYPILILPVLYGMLDLLNGANIPVWDSLVQGWEQRIFGGQVSLTWWQSMPSQFWSTLLHAAYFGFYLIVPFPVFYFLARGKRAEARVAVQAIVATFVVCYVIFLLFPVAGPYYQFPRPTGSFVDNWAARLVYATLSQGSSYGAAFPSSHVAATIAATIATWHGSRRVGLLLLAPTALLTVGVVYCQMHYAIDALTGLILPLLLVPPVILFARRAARETAIA